MRAQFLLCRLKPKGLMHSCHLLRAIISTGIVGDTNHQCSKQRLSPEKETCEYAQKACLVCGKNAGGASNHKSKQ